MTLSLVTSRPAGNANITTIRLAEEAILDATGRDSNLPGLVVMSGEAGAGKTMSMRYIAGRHQAYYLRCMSVWTRKSMLEAILSRLAPDAKPGKSTAALMTQVINVLQAEGAPLILDEFDYVAEARLVDLVRDIHDAARVPIMMVGEEKLPQVLKSWPRFYDRVLSWVYAVPANLEDARALAGYYCNGITVEDELLELFVARCKGNVRRISLNLDALRKFAVFDGIDAATLDWWGERPIDSGEAPKRPAPSLRAVN